MRSRKRKADGEGAPAVGSENLQPGTGGSRKSEDITDDIIEVRIREVIRIKAVDLAAVKHSFEKWASQWTHFDKSD